MNFEVELRKTLITPKETMLFRKLQLIYLI